MMKVLQLILTVFLAVASAEYKSYAGYQVLRVEIPNRRVGEILHSFEDIYDFWTDIRIGSHVDIMIPPGDILPFILQESGFTFSTIIENVQTLIDAEQMALKAPKADDWWSTYHTFEDITAKLAEIASNSNGKATIEVIGQSYESRNMTVVKVCSTGACGVNPGMYIESGIHAREWISPAVSTWMLNELLTNAANVDYVNNLDWYFLVNVNPDGYAYTWEHDRMWRKSRSPNLGSNCVGTDPNRNFAVGFGDQGASPYPCSETYHGPEPWSEIEIKNVRDFVTSIPNLKFFQDLHSYSELILLPYGYKSSLPDDYDRQFEIATRGNEAIKATHGLSYTYGNTWDTIYPASGIAVDWGFEGANANLSISVELRDKGLFGFQLPANQIVPCAEEIWSMHKVYATQVSCDFGNCIPTTGP